ncbi:hypothetical protein MMC10_009843 [Thelotrema lepadinum]|nr:hypothetical protein [Thelotrema lepadinum]
MKLAAHHVLANTVAGQATMFEHATFLSDEEKSIKDIDGLIGLSPELLDIIQDVTMLPSAMSGGSLKSRLLKLTQELLDMNLTAEAKRVIISTAETTLDQKETADTEDVLIQTLEDLPMSGPLYRALHPLWSLFMCSVTIVHHRARVESMLGGFTYPPTSVLGPFTLNVTCANGGYRTSPRP